MASEIHPVVAGQPTGKRVYTITYTKGDGSPGEIESPPVPTLSDTSLATVNDEGLVSPGVFQASVVHNGANGVVILTFGQVDGDLGAGVFPIGPFDEQITMLAPLGATAGVVAAGDETAP